MTGTFEILKGRGDKLFWEFEAKNQPIKVFAHKPPELGDSFRVLSERWWYVTSPVKELRELPWGWEFDTKNSTYRFTKEENS